MAAARPRRGALGLRGRIVGALLVTTAATLGVAAVALLGPLEHSLRNAARQTLLRDLGRHPTSAFVTKLDLSALLNSDAGPGSPGSIARDSLNQQQQLLANRIGGVVEVLGYPDGSGHGYLLLRAALESDSADSDPFDDVVKAFQTGHQVPSFGTIGGKDYARVALPFKQDGLPYVLAARRPIDEIPGAVRAVRTAFITAALAGLALTLVLGIPLAATLGRRLRRLRQAALQLAQEGPVVEVPGDRARDEVGDLARSFALMQHQLHQQEEARRAFVATASHELRTPLTSLEGMLELLEDELRSGDPPDVQDARLLLARARAQSRRLGRLAVDLLDLSRLDAEVKLRSEPVELGEISRAVLAEFARETSERGIVAELEDPAGPVWALGDPGSVARILRILLDNAVRVSRPGEKLKVAARGGEWAALSVRDRGPGVPANERELIFERFQRGRDTGGQAGFGLGLAIGRELAERMGGELRLQDADGTGAEFMLELPLARAQEEDSSGSAS